MPGESISGQKGQSAGQLVGFSPVGKTSRFMVSWINLPAGLCRTTFIFCGSDSDPAVFLDADLDSAAFYRIQLFSLVEKQ